jgi:hypothetical protein
MSLIIIKRFLYGEMPSLRDSTVMLLLAMHFVTFILLHSNLGSNIMDRIRRCPLRRFIQEVFKGYGKGLKLLALV